MWQFELSAFYGYDVFHRAIIPSNVTESEFNYLWFENSKTCADNGQQHIAVEVSTTYHCHVIHFAEPVFFQCDQKFIDLLSV